MNELKFSILNYINHFGIYDYIAYIWLFLTFLILISLSLLLLKKSTKLSIILLLFSFILLLAGPFVLKYFLDKTVRPVEISKLKYQKLHFSNTLIVDFTLKNISKKPYSLCQINTKVYKTSKSKLKKIINRLKPISARTILVKRILKANKTLDNRVVFYNFIYPGNINVSVSAECYRGSL